MRELVNQPELSAAEVESARRSPASFPTPALPSRVAGVIRLSLSRAPISGSPLITSCAHCVKFHSGSRIEQRQNAAWLQEQNRLRVRVHKTVIALDGKAPSRRVSGGLVNS